MKLYLSSYRIPVSEKFIELLPSKPQKVRLGVIPNAKDYLAEFAWDYKTKELLDYLRTLGFEPKVVDLRAYKPDTIEAELKNYDVVWVNGGNTFCLRDVMRSSGFETVIKKLLMQGLVYGGESAGACVAGPTLKGVELADEPEFTKHKIFDGLNLIPQIVVPHVDNPSFGEAAAEMIEMYEGNPNVVALADNQALVIDGEEMETITAPASVE